MTSDRSCGMSSSQCSWHFKTLNPCELLYHTKFSREPILRVVEYEFTSEGLTSKRLSDLLFVTVPSYYAFYPDLSDKLSVKATAVSITFI